MYNKKKNKKHKIAEEIYHHPRCCFGVDVSKFSFLYSYYLECTRNNFPEGP